MVDFANLWCMSVGEASMMCATRKIPNGRYATLSFGCVLTLLLYATCFHFYMVACREYMEEQKIKEIIRIKRMSRSMCLQRIMQPAHLINPQTMYGIMFFKSEAHRVLFLFKMVSSPFKVTSSL